GRLDSTNVCLPEVALITSVSFDHTRQLGNKLASIAGEKAGIIKPGRPVISGTTVPEARAVIEQICSQRQARLRQLGIDFRYKYQPGKVSGYPTAHHSPLTSYHSRPPRVEITTSYQTWPLMELGLLGEHQAANAAVAVGCIEELRQAGWDISELA